MTTGKTDEGNLGQPSGGAEPSTSQTSGSPSQPLPEYVKTLMDRLDEQDKFIKGLQKGTDKRFERQEGNIKRILELKDRGLDEAQIERELFIDQLYQGQKAPEAKPTPDKSDKASGFDISAIDAALELPANDSRVTDLKLKFGSDPIAYLREAHKLKSQLSSTSPTPAEMPLPQGGAKTEKSVEALKADYIKEIQTMRGNKQGIKAVQEKYRKLGINPGSIDFRL
jgi:hypothetical protein